MCSPPHGLLGPPFTHLGAPREVHENEAAHRQHTRPHTRQHTRQHERVLVPSGLPMWCSSRCSACFSWLMRSLGRYGDPSKCTLATQTTWKRQGGRVDEHRGCVVARRCPLDRFAGLRSRARDPAMSLPCPTHTRKGPPRHRRRPPPHLPHPRQRRAPAPAPAPAPPPPAPPAARGCAPPTRSAAALFLGRRAPA